MAIRLSKGQKVDITKAYPGLNKVIVGLGWDANSINGSSFDLDASAFLLNSSGKVENEKDFIFYNNPSGANGAVAHSGDSRKGQFGGDTETITINFDSVPRYIERIAFTITIFEGEIRRQTFGQVRNAYVRILNGNTGEVILQYDLGQHFSVETAIVAAEVYRNQGEWKFNAIGSGFGGGLGALCRNFGLEVEEERHQSSYNAGEGNDLYTQPQNHSGFNSPQTYEPSHSQSNNNSYFNSQQLNPVQQSNGFGGQNLYNANQSQFSNDGGVTCPRCHSSRVTGGKKGFSLGKAAIGGIVLGPLGLLGGFLGSNKIEFGCLDCKQKWTPDQNRNTMQWLDDQRRNVQNIVARHKSPEAVDAIVAACALVAMADGVLQHSEQEQMVNYFRSSDEWRQLDINNVISRFDYYVNQLKNNGMNGRIEAMRAVGKMSQKPEMARLIARLACAIGGADGEFSSVEKGVVNQICRELNLNPNEFVYS